MLTTQRTLVSHLHRLQQYAILTSMIVSLCWLTGKKVISPARCKRSNTAILGGQKLTTKSLNYLNSIRIILAEIPEIHQSKLKQKKFSDVHRELLVVIPFERQYLKVGPLHFSNFS